MSSAVHDLLKQEHAGRVQFSGNFPIDANVVAKFPQGTRILSADRHGVSEWMITARLLVELPDGKRERYFLKCASEEPGRRLMEGEYNAMLELYEAMPSLIPKPHSWGRYAVQSPETYFFMQQYIEMSNQMPEPNQLCKKLALLHQNSQSPTGKFGFHVNTCQGSVQQDVGWEESWMVLFKKMVRHVINLDFDTNGYWKEIDVLEQRMMQQLIPRLIGALESHERSIKPSLIHADLWEGNTGTSVETGDVYIFDAAALYGHNEMEIGDWRCHYNKIHNRIYRETYLKHFPPSEPEEEWDDRNRMYSIYFNIIYSVNHKKQGAAVRQTAFDDMYYLIDKYAPFEERKGPPRLRDDERVSLSAERDHTI